MKVIFHGQVPKDLNFPESNEDAIALSEESYHLAISDGASESFDSQTWANLLVRQFIDNPIIDDDWLLLATNRYLSNFDLTRLSWAKEAAFERGSFATLLGVRSTGEYIIDVTAVGDSLAVLVDTDNYIDSFPYRSSVEFLQRPFLFCTNLNNNEFLLKPEQTPKIHQIWSVQNLKSPFVLCMTDALGEWALKKQSEGDPQWDTLIGITDTSQLSALVQEERAGKEMRIDDVTLVTISLFGEGRDELPHA